MYFVHMDHTSNFRLSLFVSFCFIILLLLHRTDLCIVICCAFPVFYFIFIYVLCIVVTCCGTEKSLRECTITSEKRADKTEDRRKHSSRDEVRSKPCAEGVMPKVKAAHSDNSQPSGIPSQFCLFSQ